MGSARTATPGQGQAGPLSKHALGTLLALNVPGGGGVNTVATQSHRITLLPAWDLGALSGHSQPVWVGSRADPYTGQRGWGGIGKVQIPLGWWCWCGCLSLK